MGRRQRGPHLGKGQIVLQRRQFIAGILIALSVGLLVLAGASVSRSHRSSRLHDQALMELRAGQYSEARGFFEQALALRPEEPTYLANYGLCMEMLEEYPAAAEAYRQSLDAAEDPEVLFQLGRATCLGGEPDRGVQMMWEAHSLVMLTPREAGDLGLCLLETGRPDQALPYLQRAAEASPDNPDLRSALTRAGGFPIVAP